MARNVPNVPINPPMPGDVNPHSTPMPRGGSAGVIQQMQAQQLLGQTALAPSAVRPADCKPAPQFRVINGGMCMLDNMRVPIRQGKLLDESQYDLGKLRAQGIILELVPVEGDPTAEQAVVEEQKG
jgi:hypothetical protein